MAETHTLPNRTAFHVRPSAEPTSDLRTNRPAMVAPVAPKTASGSAAPPSWNLTPQQWRVFLLVGRALSNKAIAHELKVAESTVKAHISAIFKVSGCRNRTEAALLSLKVRYGLLDDNDTGASSTALNDLRRVTRAGSK
jgi:DNA-binding NarL/FixJ family response regulator